jgi:hypothetical protein
MASRAVKSDELSNLLLAKALYFVFILFILKSQIKDLAVLVNSTELSLSTERPICYIQCYKRFLIPLFF